MNSEEKEETDWALDALSSAISSFSNEEFLVRKEKP